jgi:hypothetical protein
MTYAHRAPISSGFQNKLMHILVEIAGKCEAAALAPRAATRPPRRRAWLRISVVRCGSPCAPPVRGCVNATIPRHERAVLTAWPPARAGQRAGHWPQRIVARATLRLALKSCLLRHRKAALLPSPTPGERRHRGLARRRAAVRRRAVLVMAEGECPHP